MKLPNNQMLKELVETYWGNDPNPDQDDWTSFHLRQLSREFGIELESDGELVSLTGLGFGTVTWGSLPHRLIEQLSIGCQLLGLSNKRAILKLRGRASGLTRDMWLNPTLDVFR